LLDKAARRRRSLAFGTVAIGIFVGLRATGFYGDPADRVRYDAFLPTLLSFLNCEKYPPSLLYLTMTLGPALIALGLIDEVRGRFTRVIVTFGRVPMFYYLVHIYVVHAVAVVYAWFAYGDVTWLFGGKPVLNKPAGYGASLPWVYVAWIAIVAALYPLCRWFADVKQRRKDWWLSYL
jgi:uncharacterized membrane protein